MVLGLVALLVITSMDSVLMLVPSEATRQTIGWVFGGTTFGFTYLVFFVIYSVIACVALYRSYRESGIEERKQVRWPLWGTIVSLSGVLLVIGLIALLDWFGLQRFLPIVVAEHIVQVLRVHNAVIFRKSLREQTFMPAVEVGLHDRIERTTLLKGVRFAGNTPLLASGVAFRPSSRLPDSEQLAVKQLGTALIVPMRRGDEAVGFISLGRKLSDQEFEPDEIEFLAAAADQTASAIYNLGLRKQAQEYQEAREIQERLLPKQIPQAPGLEISGSWRPARIVGGDYFDVL
jgi:hypothetical protein